MRLAFHWFFFLLSLNAIAQQDTIVITDYSKVLVGADQSGTLLPITSLDEVNRAGLFIEKGPLEGQLKICHPSNLFVWVDGKLLDQISGCKFYDPEDLFKLSSSDTVYVSFSSKEKLSGFICEQVVFEKLLVVKDESSIPRTMNSSFFDFVIVGVLILAFFMGFLVVSYPNRIAYIKRRSFTFKISSYEFVNTNFFHTASLNILIFCAISFSFIIVYLNMLLGLKFFDVPKDFITFMWTWISLSFFILALFLLKWVIVTMMCLLFKLRSLKDYQMFDFLNFNTIVQLGLLLFVLIDFVVNPSHGSWIGSGFLHTFPMAIIVYVIWFSFKFVNNSPRKKLVIISYLCATEIIPMIVLLGMFYK